MKQIKEARMYGEQFKYDHGIEVLFRHMDIFCDLI